MSISDSTHGRPLEVSVVIPCLNESLSIAHCVEQATEALRAADISGEVLVADNGSTDGSAEIAEQAGARVVHVAERGYGAAVRGGVRAASGQFIVLGDADGQHDFSEVPKFVEELREGYELVMGNRFGGTIMPGAMSWTHRYLGNPILSGLVRVLFHRGVHDAQCGMRGLRSDVFEEMDLRTNGFEFCPEMVVKASRRQMRITEIPITVLPAVRDRPPHLRTITDGWRHLIFILMCSPNWFLVAPGAAVLGVGLATVTWLSFGAQHVGNVVLSTRMELFGVLIATLGFQMMAVGVFARVFSYSSPRHTRHRSMTSFLESLRLEQGLAAGAVLMLVGLVGDLVELSPWIFGASRAIRDTREVIFWSLWLILGLQVCLSSFFLSMIGISRGRWVGNGVDLELRRPLVVAGSE